MGRLASALTGASLCLSFSFTPARADGFGFWALGACATGLSASFVARACPNDPSSIYFNPAALSLVSGTRVTFGGNIILSSSRYEYAHPLLGQVTIPDRNETFLTGHVFVSRQLSPRVTVGLGVFTPYGLGTEWPVTPDNLGRFVAYNTEIIPTYFQPTVAVRLHPKVSVGAGLDVVYATAYLDRLVDLREVPGTESLDPTIYPPLAYSAAEARISSDGWSMAFAAAVLVEPIEWVSIGLRYLSQTTVDFEGDLTFTQTPLADQGAPDADLLDPIVAAALPAGALATRGDFRFPDQLVAGIEVRPIPRWTFAFTYQWTDWSDVDTVVIEVEGQAPPVLSPVWGDASQFRFGVAFEAAPRLSLRGGLVHDPTPADPAQPFGVSVFLPDATRNEVSLGVGWRLAPRVQADVYWLGVFFNRTDGCVVPTGGGCAVPAPASRPMAFRTTAHLLGANLSLSL